MNELTEHGTEKLAYDEDGRLTKEGSNTYTWNDRGQLSTVTQSSKTWTYSYDPLGRRTKTAVSGSGETTYLYDGQNVAAEGNGTSTTAELLNGLALDERYARKTSAGTSTYLTDALASTMALANSEGTIATEYTYDPFGNATSKGTASENRFQYTGREAESNNLVNLRARYYQPGIGRFISRDPLGEGGSDHNLYRYAGASPLALRDPMGLSECCDNFIDDLPNPSPTLVNAAAGFGDGLLWGASAVVRLASASQSSATMASVVDMTPSAYANGLAAGTALWSVITPGPASTVATSVAAANAAVRSASPEPPPAMPATPAPPDATRTPALEPLPATGPIPTVSAPGSWYPTPGGVPLPPPGAGDPFLPFMSPSPGANPNSWIS